jgi:hypothetical protein
MTPPTAFRTFFAPLSWRDGCANYYCFLLPRSSFVKTTSVPESPGQRKKAKAVAQSVVVSGGEAGGDRRLSGVHCASSGRFVAVLHCGYSDNEIIILDLEERLSRGQMCQAFSG